MKTPTQEQFQVVIDNLEKVNKENDNAIVDMDETEFNYCGTPMCHGGWYAVSKSSTGDMDGYHTFTQGAMLMADDLGFSQNDEVLRSWAKDNPEIWGNDSGYYMFSSENAFNKEWGERFTLQTIIDHWKGVKERAAAL